MSRAPALSVVVLSYNARERIDLALGSLRTQTIKEPFEVIVVDSGDDGTDEYVRAHYPDARLVRSEERLGVGAARNRGAAVARAPYVAFLADDFGGAVKNGTPFCAIGSAGFIWWAYASYPRLRWWNALKRIARGRPRWLPAYLGLTPLIWAGLAAAGAGARAEQRAAHRATASSWAGAEPAPDAAE